MAGKSRIPDSAKLQEANALPIVDTAAIPKSKLFVDLRGQRFNMWAVYGFAGQTPSGQSMWHCICQCGTRKIVNGYSLQCGNSNCCGCMTGELSSRERIRKHSHGMNRTPEHMAWKNAIQRCCNQNYREWEYYGGRGIKFAAEWRDDFMAFYRHVGPRPDPSYSLDRIDNNGHYEPGNVRWAQRVMQSRNRRNAIILKIEGELMHLTDAVKIGPVTMTTYRRRLQLGWSPEKAISTPPTRYRRVNHPTAGE